VWRLASPADDDAVVAMCLSLNREDPGPRPVGAEQVRRTLAALRQEPLRGRTIVLDLEGRVAGYALLVSFWSNELGGETCVVDEVYVVPEERGRGHASRLLQDVARDRTLWPREPAAVSVEVTPANERARVLYRRLGFSGGNVALILRPPWPPSGADGGS